MTCEVDGCERQAKGRWCSTHKSRVEMYGVPEWDPIPIDYSPGAPQDVVDRLLEARWAGTLGAYCDARSIIDLDDDTIR